MTAAAISARKSRRARWLLLLPALLLLAAIGFYAWAELIPAPMPEALQALVPDPQVQVSTSPWLTFFPANSPSPTTGFIFYPGGRVDERAYAPAAHAIAAAGYLVVVPAMPLHLAVFAPERAAEIQAAFPQVKKWVLGGHSLGGSMAAQYAYEHPDRVQGLVLWASYPAGSASLAGRSLPVTSISASLDGLATPEKIAASRALLPATTTWIVIQGGDHAQFGWYGPQAGDHPASIPRQAQQNQVIAATLELLKRISR